MKELARELEQFKQITMELIKAINLDEIHRLDALLDNRQMIIENMEKLQYTTEEFTSMYNELDMISIQQELSILLQAKKDNTKEELSKIQMTKSANSNYNKSFYANSSMFNKKI